MATTTKKKMKVLIRPPLPTKTTSFPEPHIAISGGAQSSDLEQLHVSVTESWILSAIAPPAYLLQ